MTDKQSVNSIMDIKIQVTGAEQRKQMQASFTDKFKNMVGTQNHTISGSHMGNYTRYN